MGPVALDNMPGGLAQSFFAHFLLQVRRNGWIKDGNDNVGFDMEVRLRKSKVGGENWRSAVVPFRVDGGIDVMESFIREGITQKLIQQSGPWYTYRNEKVMGMNFFLRYTVDYWISELGMVIEADGVYGHLQKRDVKRDMDLMTLPMIKHVLHIKDVSYKDVKETIWQALNKLE